MTPKNTICLWFNKEAQDAARFYAATFPNSDVTAVHKAPGDYPAGQQGDVLMVEFTVLGIPCLGLNGGPDFKHSEAFSFQIATDTQEETDRLTARGRNTPCAIPPSPARRRRLPWATSIWMVGRTWSCQAMIRADRGAGSYGFDLRRRHSKQHGMRLT